METEFLYLVQHLLRATAKSLQSCPTLCDPMDCSLQGSSIHGVFQARVLEWGAVTFSTSLGRGGKNERRAHLCSSSGLMLPSVD